MILFSVFSSLPCCEISIYGQKTYRFYIFISIVSADHQFRILVHLTRHVEICFNKLNHFTFNKLLCTSWYSWNVILSITIYICKFVHATRCWASSLAKSLLTFLHIFGWWCWRYVYLNWSVHVRSWFGIHITNHGDQDCSYLSSL
jgi:hypothetical protein